MTELEWAKEFGNNLKSLLEEWGVSQKELSEMSGISEPTISRCLRGEYVPNIRTVINIGHALNCDVEDLIDFCEHIK